MPNVDLFFLCTWGDIQLFVSKFEWEAGETQVVHDLANGSIHPVQPRGSHLRKATATLMFDDFIGQAEDGITAFRRFAATTSERRIFTHPIDGSYFARIGDFKPSLDESSVMTATCEFIPDGQVQPVSPSGAGSTATSGESSVAAAADVMSSALADRGVGFQPSSISKLDFSKPIDLSISTAFNVNVSASASFSANVSASASASAAASASASATATATATASLQASANASAFAFAAAYAAAFAVAQVTAVAPASGMTSSSAFAFAHAAAALDTDARTSVASWTDEGITTRKIMNDTARLSDSIGAMIEVGGFERDLALWPAFRASIMLGEAIRSAAVAATSETPAVFVMRVQSPVALIAIAARIYGGQDAQARTRQILALNDIRTPGWLDPGDYLMPQRPTTSDQGDI